MPEPVNCADATQLLALARAITVRVVGRRGLVAEELAAEAHHLLLVALAKKRTIRAPRAWLQRVIQRACSHVPRERWTELPLGVEELDRIAAPQAGVEDDSARNLRDLGGGLASDARRFLSEVLPTHLKPRARAVLELSLEGYEPDAIAEKLGLRREQAERSWRVIVRKARSLMRKRAPRDTTPV